MKRSSLQIKVISVGSNISMIAGMTNCVVVWRRSVAVVADPGGEATKIARFLKRMKLTVGAYWLTHAHPDHVNGLSELLDEFPAPVCYHRADSRWIRAVFPIVRIRQSEWFRPFGNISKITCGDIAAKVIQTPGHTRGSVCYWFEDSNVLLSGDTLFKGCVGATLYPGGDSEELADSLWRLFRKIPNGTLICPGHGEMTNSGAERIYFAKPNKQSHMKSTFNKIYISFDKLERSFNKVRKELERMGLLFAGSRLDGVDCYHEQFSLGALPGLVGTMGFYDFEDQCIHVPAFYSAGMFPKWFEERQIGNVLRHEFGHALADKYRKFFRGGIFKEAFGKSYGTGRIFDGDDWEAEHVSSYATTDTREDFAETFMLYMKYKGKMPARYRGKRAIVKKWKTVGRIVREVAALGK